MPLLLDLVGPTGQVTGVDRDPVSLDAAHQRLSATPHRNWRLEQALLQDYDADISGYDVVLLFNSIGYFQEPFSVLETIARRVRTGGVVIVKDFDLESFFFSPRETSPWASLIAAAKERNDTDNPVSFNNFFGRKVHTLHRASTFREWANQTWTQLMTFPFDSFQQEYIWRNVECLLKQAGEECPAETQAYFHKLFFPPAPRFFDNPDAMFVEVEYLTLLWK
jgi:SAM-dependent methyltransferase